RIVAALDYLDEKRMLDVKAEGVRHRYRVVQRPSDLDALSRRLHERTLRREANEVQRLQQVVDLIERDGCQVAALCAYFGEQREPCGHCSWCLNHRSPARLPPRAARSVDDAVQREARALRREFPRQLGDARAMARF